MSIKQFIIIVKQFIHEHEDFLRHSDNLTMAELVKYWEKYFNGKT